MLSIEDKPPKQDVYVTNDTLEPWEGTLRWSLETLDGKILSSGQEPVQAAPQAATLICELDFSDSVSDDNIRELVFIAELYQGWANHLTGRQPSLPRPSIFRWLIRKYRVQLRIEQEQFRIELKSRSLARLVECSLEGADVVFSDNYFDLPAGRTVTVSAPLPDGWTLSQAQAAFKVRSVYDLFAHGAAK